VNDPVRDTSVGELLDRRARSHPRRVFAVLADGEIGYGDFNATVNRVAAALHALGVAKGDRVVCTLPNGREMLYVFFAVARLGAVNVFINPQYDVGLFGAVAGSIQPKAYILDADNMAKVRQLGLAGQRIVGAGGEVGEAGELAFQALLESDAADAPPVTVLPGDPVQYIFTSGTTGFPKACILSHRARLSLSEHVVRLFGARDEDRFFGCLPNYHGNLYFAILGGLIAGASFALADRFHASRYWDLVRSFQATVLVLHGVPMNILLQAPPGEQDRRHPARGVLSVGGRYKEFVARFGLNSVLVNYGATEVGLTSLAVLSSWAAARAPASFVGWVRDDHELRIVRDDGATAALGESGEIQVRARVPFTTFSGYHTADGPQGQADGLAWYSTHDRGSLGEDGALQFFGRMDDSVRVKGEFVPVDYLEGVVREHPAVEDCAVVGIPSDLGEQDLALFVQTRAGETLSGIELIEHLRPRVPKFMVPELVEFVPDFPRAPATLKIQKKRLVEMNVSRRPA